MPTKLKFPISLLAVPFYTIALMGSTGDNLQIVRSAFCSVESELKFVKEPADQAGYLQSDDAAETVEVEFVAEVLGATSYQWRKDGVAIPGANAATLKFSACLLDNGAKFDLVASNGAASLTSRTAILTVELGEKPKIIEQPKALTIKAGETATFTIKITGKPAPDVVHWMEYDPIKDDAVEVGEGMTLVLPNVGKEKNGCEYYAHFCNALGCVMSETAVLTVE